MLEGLKMVTNCHLCSAEFKDKSRLVDHLAIIHKWLDQLYFKSIPLPEKSAKADNTAGVTGLTTNSFFLFFGKTSLAPCQGNSCLLRSFQQLSVSDT